MATPAGYPVRVEAELDTRLSRWLWLVKWFLAIPHFVVLWFLWVAYAVLTVVAFFSILFTGRYPRSIFEFNVGVLRWSWRVADYAFGVLATDRYPPFTLAVVPDYPAHLEVAYPEKLSRGLVLVKWWLLAIPHYIVVGILAGGGVIAWETRDEVTMGGNLIGVLVFIAMVALLFTGRYPRGLFDLILGLNRWVIRVAAYVGLMTDEYPPFRLDMGGHEPGTATIPVEEPQPGAPGAGAPGAGGWTAGPIIALILGTLLVLGSTGLLAAGGGALWLDQTQRDAEGFISTGTQEFETDTYALVSEGIETQIGVRSVYEGLVDEVRIRVTPDDAADEIFVGIGAEADVDRYLAGVSHATISNPVDPSYETIRGGAVPSAPAEESFWTDSATGAGEQTLIWPGRSGTWAVVIMAADAAPGIGVTADVGSTLPALTGIGAGLLVAGVVSLGIGVLVIVLAVRRGSATV